MLAVLSLPLWAQSRTEVVHLNKSKTETAAREDLANNQMQRDTRGSNHTELPFEQHQTHGAAKFYANEIRLWREGRRPCEVGFQQQPVRHRL